MIALAVKDGRRVFVGELDEGDAYVDADWLTGVTAGPVPAVVATGGSLGTSWDGRTFPLTGARPAQEVVSAALHRLAAGAAAEAGSAERPLVAGDGLVAACTRMLLGTGSVSDAPDLVVESRGDPGSLVESTRRVADLGTVVLTGTPVAQSFAFDLYPDVHVRGLRVVALPIELDFDDEVVGELPAPVHVRLGEPIGDARWYRVTAR